MKDSIILEGKIYISASRAAKIINYTQDYIGQLCRSGKLDCKMIGRSWFVTESSLLEHRESTIDSTEEKISKIIQEAKIEDHKVKLEDSKIEKSVFKYETEKSVYLPPLVKTLPTSFSIPRKSSNVINLGYINSIKSTNGNTSAITSNFSLTTLVFAAIMITGSVFAFTLFYPEYNKSISSLQASLSSLAQNNIDTPSVENPTLEINSTTDNLNGMGVVRSTNSLSENNVAKDKIRSSFSDDVTIKPDTSGTAGVITPIFKKTNGDDFLYVLVPVNNKK
jgi:hypothetical protein